MPAPVVKEGRTEDRQVPVGAQGTLPKIRYGAQRRKAFQRRYGNPEEAARQDKASVQAALQRAAQRQERLKELVGQNVDTVARVNTTFNSIAQQGAAATATVVAALTKARESQASRYVDPSVGAPLPRGTFANGTTAYGRVDLSNWSGQALPEWYKPKLASWQGVVLQRRAMKALQLASKALGVAITGGGYRSHSEQAALKAAKPTLAATPGRSLHEVGLAIDVDVARLQRLGVWERARRLLAKFGFHQFDAGKEPWHFSYFLTG